MVLALHFLAISTSSTAANVSIADEADGWRVQTLVALPQHHMDHMDQMDCMAQHHTDHMDRDVYRLVRHPVLRITHSFVGTYTIWS